MPNIVHNSKKRHGRHHRHTKRYIKVYAPYLPLLISIVASLLLSYWRPADSAHTLSYATEMSISSLLSATNSQRAANGASGLSISSRLNGAAQAKANDMIARNYWSHTTPDGQEPWVFIDNAGYQYTKAGENLAYGFATSSAAVDGWMNSPSHRENLLDSAFSDVGFGFANGSSYNGDGEETVVVAMYGAPHVLPATTPQSTPAPAPAPTPQPSTPAPQPAAPTPAPTPTTQQAKPATPLPVTTDLPVAKTPQKSQPINRSQMLTGVPWALGSITIALGIVILFKLLHVSLKLKRALKEHPKLRHALTSGERFVLHHPLLDSTILGLALLTYVLSRVVGVIL